MATSPATEPSLRTEPEPAARGWAWLRVGARVRPRVDTAAFSHEFGLLLGAGVPMLDALAALREQGPAHGRSGAWIEAVMHRLQAGERFSLAMTQGLAECGLAPEPLLHSTVAAAERGGTLPQALAAHARHVLWLRGLRQRLMAAALYPALLVLASVAVLLFLLIVVVPRFAGMLENRLDALPAASRVLLALGEAAGAQPLLTILLALAALLAPIALALLPATQAAATRLAWQLPGLGRLLRELALARLYRTLAMLLDAGVPALSALRTLGSEGPLPLRTAIAAAERSVAEGQRLSAALDLHGLATPVARRMLRVGERSGRLGPMLGEAASFHDGAAERLAELASKVVNPALMLLMGGLIGALVVLLYLPIFELAQGLG
jgi:general secretion pathway protein F